MYIFGKYQIYLFVLYKQIEKSSFSGLFHWVQINYIFTNNVHIYCVDTAMAESPKQLPIFTEMSRNKCHSNHFQGPPLSSLCTITISYCSLYT